MEDNTFEFKKPSRRHLLLTFMGVLMGMGIFLTFMKLGFYKDDTLASVSEFLHLAPSKSQLQQPLIADAESEANALLSVTGTEQQADKAPEIKLNQSDINKAVLLYQSQLPVDISKEVRLDKITAKPYQLEYTLTLKNYKTSQMNTLAIEKAASAVLENKLCKTPHVRELMDKGLTVRCLYRGNDMSPLASVVIQNTNCL